MRVEYDSREKPRAIVKIMKVFEMANIEVIRRALPYGDYRNPDNPGICIDRKQNLNEVCKNLIQERPRFLREIDRCNRAGDHMIILVEHGGQIRCLTDVMKWKNPRLRTSPYAVSGERLFKIMRAMAEYYHFEWLFCDKAHTGHIILELLKDRSEDNE